MKHYYLFLLIAGLIFSGCTKEFLEKKPSSSIVNPTTLAEFQTLLDNSRILNTTGALPQLSSDEYFITDKQTFDALESQTQKNAYLWQKDIYAGETNILDWNQIYAAVFYANSVLDGIRSIKLSDANIAQWNNIKGSALYFRAFASYDLARNFCPVYNEVTAATDLGIPIRTSAGIDVTMQRSTLKETYDQIIADLNESLDLLRDDFSALNRNRPSKSAVYAILARIYLSMGKYEEAGKAADECLAKYNTLINYNEISATSATPFSYTSAESIFYSSQVIAYTTTLYTTSFPQIGVDSLLIKMYDPNDLRLSIFFAKNTLGNYNVKRGYVGGGFYAFTGLATDEVMLIKAECAARAQDAQLALTTLNQLLINRYQTGTFIPFEASTAEKALATVLQERRKELVWRALRWSDLKRLNKEGANITLKRNLTGVEYTLSPNSSLYVFPIPDLEIALSGIKQNIR